MAISKASGAVETEASAAPAPVVPPALFIEPRILVSAGESTDPAVQRLIAELNAARSNGDDAAIARHTRALESLGYSA